MSQDRHMGTHCMRTILCFCAYVEIAAATLLRDGCLTTRLKGDGNVEGKGSSGPEKERKKKRKENNHLQETKDRDKLYRHPFSTR